MGNPKGSFWGLSQFRSPIFFSTKGSRHNKALSLTGQPLDPDILHQRKIHTKEQERRRREKRSFFSHVSKQFSEASKHHFGDNIGRKINTNHLKVRSKTTVLNEKDYSEIINDTINDLTNSISGSDTDILNKTVKIDENNIYGFLNELNASSDVLSFPKEYSDPSKLAKAVKVMISRRSGSFLKHLKRRIETDNVSQQTKDKPVYKTASKEYQLMYCICKVWGVKHQASSGSKYDNPIQGVKKWNCKKKSLLPFNSLRIDPKTKSALHNKISASKGRENGNITYKASTFRPLTSEPVHKRFVKMTRRGVPVFKFSSVKVKIQLALL